MTKFLFYDVNNIIIKKNDEAFCYFFDCKADQKHSKGTEIKNFYYKIDKAYYKV